MEAARTPLTVLRDRGNVEPADQRVRVFILDDHEIFRAGLRQVLEAQGEFVVAGEASRAGDALERIAAVRPDVAVLDARLPDGSGVDVCREVVARHPGTIVLILTSYDDDDVLFGAIDAGASGFLLKQVRGAALVEALNRAVQGHSTLDESVTDRVVERLRRGPSPDPVLQRLTDQERRVFRLIGEGMSNRQIGESLSLAEKTVKNYVSSILAKLELERRTQAAVLAVRHRGVDG